MVITFHYKSIDRGIYGLWKGPIIDIELRGPKNSFRTMALLDSGADNTCLNLEIAEVLGLIKSKDYENIGGIGGKSKAYNSKVGIRIKKGHENYSFQVPAKILTDHKLPFILLGREGFFDKFIVTINEPDMKIQLKKYTKRLY